MDLHMMIVIACVFLASFFSLIFINRIFRRKTFEEVIAEKKALTANLYAQNKATVGASKKPKKKELKREKKQRQREHYKDATAIAASGTIEQEDSDALSEQPSVEDDTTQTALLKPHVEFEPDPDVIYNNNIVTVEKRRASNSEKDNNFNVKMQATTLVVNKHKKDKKNNAAIKSAVGILLNKSEPVAIKQNVTTAIIEEQPVLNNFEAKQPKDVIELKKHEKDKKEVQQPQHQQQQQQQLVNQKKEKHNKKEKQLVSMEQNFELPSHVYKDHMLKQQPPQQDDKMRQGSPKTQHNVINNKNKQQHKKQTKDQATKELIIGLDKLSENDVISVSLLMKLFRRAELNRSEIQILIDYLLNKQQDTPATHSEWSDDICQKLKRQLEEKEKALAEEQEASLGIQAKLRELRSEINTERAQMNATIKAYIEKIQGKEQEITGLNQEVQQLNDKLTLERQQFQANLLNAKQAGSQDLLGQLQMMQNELGHKDKCIAELTQFVNASRQAVEESQQRNDIIQNQAQQLRALEQQRDELEVLQNNSIFELEKLKTIEAENAEIKVEIRNIQNALESSKVDLSQAHKELDAYKNELTLLRNNELTEKQNEIAVLQTKNTELLQELEVISSKASEQYKEQSGLQATLGTLQKQWTQKEQQYMENQAKQTELYALVKKELETTRQQSTQFQQELQRLVEALRAELASKQTQLLESQKNLEQFSGKEKELLQQLAEQREKNNDIRMKNWKLIEALQNAEETTPRTQEKLTKTNANTASLVQQQQLLVQSAARNGSSTSTALSESSEQHIRALFQRLYPETVKACAASALTVSFDQWIEQVLVTLVKQTQNIMPVINNNNSSTTTNSNSGTSISSSNKSTQSNISHISSNHNVGPASNNLLLTNSSRTNSSSSVSGDSSSSRTTTMNTDQQEELHTQNFKLRRRIEELTQLVTKTSNTLLELETRAREQDEHWRTVVRQKDDVIHTLQRTNGEQGI